MNYTTKLSMLFLAVIFGLMYSCSNDVNFQLPAGPEGEKGNPGASAYEVWMEEVLKGLDNPHNPGEGWPKEWIDMQHYFYYLTGKAGQDGVDGQDGMDGQDGKTAYELWQEAVKKGLVNPHDPDGGNWPKGQITEADFWKYLRGADGKDGQDGEDGKPGEPGESGVTVVVQVGYYNVIAQYSNQAYSEYVDPTTGSVTYKVYDKAGAVAPGAVVSGLPGMDPTLEYTADANGNFTVSKDDLPTDQPISNRHGKTQTVTYNNETEVSAHNTYVPNKMQVRLRMTGSPYLEETTLVIPYVVERRVDPTMEWQNIPSYLGNLSQQVIAYEVPASNPGPYVQGTSVLWYNDITNIDESLTTDVSRNSIRRDYISEQHSNLHYGKIWDGNRHYVSVTIDSYYGETPWLNAAIEIPPIQIMPMVKSLTAYMYQPEAGIFFQGISGEFDTDEIDVNHFYAKTLSRVKSEDVDGYDSWEALKEDVGTMQNLKVLYVNFTKKISGSGSTTVSNDPFEGTYAEPVFDIKSPFYVGSSCNIRSYPQNHYFRSFNYGVFILDENSDTPGTFELRPAANQKANYPGVSPILVTVIPSRNP